MTREPPNPWALVRGKTEPTVHLFYIETERPSGLVGLLFDSAKAGAIRKAVETAQVIARYPSQQAASAAILAGAAAFNAFAEQVEAAGEALARLRRRRYQAWLAALKEAGDA